MIQCMAHKFRISEHKIFRLGDIVERVYQIFETIEKKNFKVGCVSPFNASTFHGSAYFIPDPGQHKII